MKKSHIIIYIACLLCLSLTTKAKTYSYESVKNDPTQTRIYTLSNGLKVYISVNKQQPRVTAHIAVNTGSKNDPAETTGLAHYLEHLMFKGSQRFGTTDYAKEKPYLDRISDLYEEYRKLTDPLERKAKYHEIDSVSQIAAQFNIPNEYDKMMSIIGSEGTNAYTSYDVTCYVEDLPANEIERWCMVQSDRFQNMVMRGFHTELEAVYEEKNISLTKDGRKSTEALLKCLFPTHSYGTQTTLGTQEHLKNPSQVNIRNYFKKYYVPNNVAICMAGDINPDETIALIDRYFGSWKPGTDANPRTFEPQRLLTAPKDTTVLGNETEHLLLGWRLNGAASLQNDTITMIDMLLSNGDVGLIDIDLNKKMTVLGAGSGIWDLKDYSIFMLEGTPNEGQTLEEVRTHLLAELDKIKRGDWDEKLIHSIVLNEKLAELNSLDNNRARVSTMVDAYILGRPWQQQVEKLDRLDRLTKADIVKWANDRLDHGCVCAYKRKGDDTTIVKIDKPAITAIPSNRDLKSQYLADYEKMEVEPIQPVFVDFNKELTFDKTKNGLDIVYKKNETDERFKLEYRFNFGYEADNNYNIASDLTDLFGTKTKSPEQIMREFYDLACSYNITVNGKDLSVSVSGLQENMEKAVKLLDDFMLNIQPDTAVYSKYIGQVQKSRMESRTNQNLCYGNLVTYGLYGAKNMKTNQPTPAMLRDTNPAVYTKLLNGLFNMKHDILYWGPADMKQLKGIISKCHHTPKHLADVPANKPYETLRTDSTEIFIAPYSAKNIYMRMIHNAKTPVSIEQKPVIKLFNEYFGGSMNAIVFQELREARGLAYNASAAYVSPMRKNECEYYLQHIISQNDKMMDCINTFKEITDTLPQSQTLFNTAKNSIMKSIAAQRTKNTAVFNAYYTAKDAGIDYDINRLYFEKIPTLTLKDLVNFEQKYIKGKPMKYLILGDENELDMQSLRKLGTIHRLTLDDIFPAYK